jgi:hypothetical protein
MRTLQTEQLVVRRAPQIIDAVPASPSAGARPKRDPVTMDRGVFLWHVAKGLAGVIGYLVAVFVVQLLLIAAIYVTPLLLGIDVTRMPWYIVGAPWLGVLAVGGLLMLRRVMRYLDRLQVEVLARRRTAR